MRWSGAHVADHQPENSQQYGGNTFFRVLSPTSSGIGVEAFTGAELN